MKTFTKLISLLIAVMMVFALALPIAAATGDYTLTINGKAPDHTYEAYQVFAGDFKNQSFEVYSVNEDGEYYQKITGEYVLITDVDPDTVNAETYKGTTDGENFTATIYALTTVTEDVLTNITWGNGVNGDDLLDDLKATTDENLLGTDGKSLFEGCTNAEDVAAVVKTFQSNGAQIDAFAAIVGQNLSDIHTDSGESTEKKENDTTYYEYKIENLAGGYYFVKDQNGSVGEDDAYTKYMLYVIKNETIDAKADKPTLDKFILDENGQPKKNVSANVGEIIDFKLESNVPDMNGYKKYTFKITDTMSKGLTFNEDVEVRIGGTPLTKISVEDAAVPGADLTNTFTVTTTEDADGNTIITIEVLDFIQYKDQKGDDIVVTYSATVDEDAVLGNTGNPNSAKLEYSKDPNDPKNPTGETPESKTYTYVTSIEIIKIDGTTKLPLTGAEFEITGTKQNSITVWGERFVGDENGIYYKLKDGTYTETAPTDDTADQYESTTQKYRKEAYQETIAAGETVVNATAVVDENGHLTFKGLGEGTYVIKEIKAPDGYNLLKEPITVTITCTPNDPVGTGCTWEVTGNGAAVVDGIIELTVENNKGTNLPTTGGIGTTIFYVLGGILTVGAVVLLVTKKRMREDV